VVGVADLLEHPGTRRELHDAVALDGLATSAAQVPEGGEVQFDLVLEAIGGGALTATGTIGAPWRGECRRCLEPVEGSAAVDVREVFEPQPVEGETYPLAGEQIDLEPMVRDAVLLALPLAPLCGPTCAGPAPDAFPTGPALEAEHQPDPRWAALSELEFDE
jgi:uncharacterized protein